MVLDLSFVIFQSSFCQNHGSWTLDIDQLKISFQMQHQPFSLQKMDGMGGQLKPECIPKKCSLICFHKFLNQLQGTKDTMFVVILHA